MIETTNMYYFYYLNTIGGTETFLYQLAKKYHEYDLTIVYRYGEQCQIDRLKKYVRCIKFTDQEIRCKRAFFNYGSDIIDHVHADDYYLVIHADYKAIAQRNPNFIKSIPEKINHFIGVSDLACSAFTEVTGKLCEKSYNPIEIEKPKKVLNLISATRLSREKGKERMIKLAAALDAAGIPYLWTIFTTDTDAIDNPNIAYMKPRLDISNFIAKADYLVQLSDNEGYCYSVVEALGMGIPVIVTHCPVFDEIGLKDRENCFFLDFNMKDIPVNEIYESKLKFTYTPLPDSWDKFLLKSSSNYEDERNTIYTVQALPTYKSLGIVDGQLGKIPDAGFQWDVDYDRMKLLTGDNSKGHKFVKVVKETPKQP